MARTTPDAVRGVLSGNYDCNENTNLAPFIDTASNLVDFVSTCATSKGTSLTSTTLEIIERWLAGHFYAMSDLMYSQKSTGAASATFQGQTGMGLSSTLYGQQAMIVDTSGCLAERNKEMLDGSKKKVQMVWLGKDPPDQDNPNTFVPGPN